MAQQLGYFTFFWSLAYMDWDNNNQPSREVALGKLLPRTHNGAIVLLHCTSKTNAEILDALLTQWEDQGYKFGSLQDPVRGASGRKAPLACRLFKQHTPCAVKTIATLLL